MSLHLTRIVLLPTNDIATENQREDVDILMFWELPKNLINVYMCVVVYLSAYYGL